MGAVTGQPDNYEKKDYEVAEAGNVPARCIGVIELGTHSRLNTYQNPPREEEVRKVMLIWELSGEYMADGRPFTVNWMGTNSLGEKARLRAILKSWRGKDFEAAELRRFELKNILDKCCMLNISKEPSKNNPERIYNNVLSVTPLPRQMNCEPRVNDLVDFGIGDIDTPEFEKLWPWVQKMVLESKEGKASGKVYVPKNPGEGGGSGGGGGSEPPDFKLDESEEPLAF